MEKNSKGNSKQVIHYAGSCCPILTSKGQNIITFIYDRKVFIVIGQLYPIKMYNRMRSIMAIHKLKRIDTKSIIFIPVLCGSSVIDKTKVTEISNEVTCKKCLKLLL